MKTFAQYVESLPECVSALPLLIDRPDPESYAALRDIVDGSPELESAWFAWKYGPDSLMTVMANRHGRAGHLLWPQYDQGNAIFAAVNGWIPNCRFTAGALAQGKHSGGTDLHPCHGRPGRSVHVIDHDNRFRLPGTGGRPAAIVAHPYPGNATPDDCRYWADAAGLVAHVCHDPDASWWYPGHSYAVAFTRPGQAVRWPDWKAVHWAVVPERPSGRGKVWGRAHAPAVPTLDAVAHVTAGEGA